MNRALLILIVVLLWSPASFAETNEWEAALEKGAAAYDAGDYEQALMHYAEARRIKDHPKLRVQVATLHERLGECTAARVLYEDLVAESGIGIEIQEAAKRGVEGFEECKATAAKTDAPPAAATPAMPSASSHSEATMPSGEGAKRLPPGRKAAGAAFVGAGAATIVTGGLFLMGELVPADAARCYGLREPSGCSGDFDPSFYSDAVNPQEAAYADAESVVRTHQIAAVTLLVAGTVATATGVVLLLTGKKEVRVMLFPGVVGIAGRF